MRKRKEIMEFRAEMLRFFRKYKRKLRINPRWRITIQIRRKQGTFAEVQHDYEKRRFWIYINDTLNGTSTELKDSIIHELCHIVLMPYVYKTERLIRQHHLNLGTSPKKLLDEFENTEEALVKKLTASIRRLDNND